MLDGIGPDRKDSPLKELGILVDLDDDQRGPVTTSFWKHRRKSVT